MFSLYLFVKKFKHAAHIPHIDIYESVLFVAGRFEVFGSMDTVDMEGGRHGGLV